MLASFSNTRFESQLERRYCQTFSARFSSGAGEGRTISDRFLGTTRWPEVPLARLSADGAEAELVQDLA